MKKLKYFIPSFTLMLVIFYFSMQNGEESSHLSMTITMMIQKIIPFIDVDILNFIVRKTAHASEYALLCLSYFYGFSKIKISRIYIISLSCTFLYACSDEFHQLFIPGRAGQFTDVLIDTSGGFVMLVILFIVRYIYHYYIHKSSITQ